MEFSNAVLLFPEVNPDFGIVVAVVTLVVLLVFAALIYLFLSRRDR